MLIAAIVLAVAGIVAAPADVEAIQAEDGSICFTVEYGGRTVFADIKGLPPNANPKAVKAVRQFWFKKTLADMKRADRGNPFAEPWQTKNVTIDLDRLVCEGCGGEGGRGYQAWPGKRYPSGACAVCRARDCVVYCVPSPEHGIVCVNPCR